MYLTIISAIVFLILYALVGTLISKIHLYRYKRKLFEETKREILTKHLGVDYEQKLKEMENNNVFIRSKL